MKNINPKILLIGTAVLVFAISALWYLTKKEFLLAKEGKDIVFVLETEPRTLLGHMHRRGIDAEIDHALFSSQTLTIPHDFWIEDIQSEVLGAPESMVHHGELMYTDKSDHECPSSPDNTVQTKEPVWFVSNFNLNKNFTFPKPYDVFIPRGTRLTLVGMFHNPTEQSYPDTTLRLTIRGKKDIKPDAQHRHVAYYRIVSETCIRGNTFTIPPRTSNFVRKRQKEPFVMPESGTAIMLYPHFHYWEGGLSQTISVNGVEVWKFSRPDKDGSHTYVFDSENPVSFALKKGDILDFATRYRNESDHPNLDAMAAFTFFLVKN